MGFPSNNVHRTNRRRLGRGQGPFPANVTTSASGSGSTAIITFSQPVTITGNLPLTVATLTFVSQVVTSPTVVTVTMSGAVATHAYTLASPVSTANSYQGGTVVGTSGTF